MFLLLEEHYRAFHQVSSSRRDPYTVLYYVPATLRAINHVSYTGRAYSHVSSNERAFSHVSSTAS